MGGGGSVFSAALSLFNVSEAKKARKESERAAADQGERQERLLAQQQEASEQEARNEKRTKARATAAARKRLVQSSQQGRAGTIKTTQAGLSAPANTAPKTLGGL